MSLATSEKSAPVPVWRLIAVLMSSIPLQPALSRWLYETAVELYESGTASFRIAGDLGEGVVRNLKQEALLGSIGGPCFEAVLDGPKGQGLVRFLVTREGLELRRAAGDAAVRASLN